MTYNNKNHKENLDLNSFFQEYILSLLKQTMETMMKEELTNVLNYEKYSPEVGSSRPKTHYQTKMLAVSWSTTRSFPIMIHGQPRNSKVSLVVMIPFRICIQKGTHNLFTQNS